MKYTEHYLYGTWRGMRQRCCLPSMESYKFYGARGISVYPEWAEAPHGASSRAGCGFWAFANWIEENLGPRPEGCTLDRIDTNGNYEPGNLRWATDLQQAANRRPCSRHVDRPLKYAYWHKQRQRWVGRVRIDGRYVHIGMFDTAEEASLAVRQRLAALD